MKFCRHTPLLGALAVMLWTGIGAFACNQNQTVARIHPEDSQQTDTESTSDGDGEDDGDSDSTEDSDSGSDTGADTDSDTVCDNISAVLVAVGRYCTLGYSTDGGQRWVLSEQSGSCTKVLEGVAFGNGTWLVVGSDRTVFRSLDGIDWVRIEEGLNDGEEFSLETVAWDGEQLWVAAGKFGKIVYSQDDGQRWILVEGTILAGNRVQSIAYGGAGRWIAVGDNGYVSVAEDPTKIENWTTQQLTDIDFNRVAFGQDKWVAVGDSGVIYTSTDGDTWIGQEGICSNGNLEDIVYNGTDQWLAVGYDGCAATSPTAQSGSWQESAFADIPRSGSGAYLNENQCQRWIIAANEGIVVSSRDDGETWQREDDTVFVDDMSVLLQVRAGK